MSANDSFEAELHAIEPALCLVSERHLRRYLRSLQARGVAVPDNPDLPWWVRRDDLADTTFLAKEITGLSASRLLLLTNPNDRLLDRKPIAEQFEAYGRLLFQAAVLGAVDAEALSREQARGRLATLGEPAVREIRHVLEADHLIHPDADDLAVYRLFVMLFLDLRQFQPEALPDFFPSLPGSEAVLRILPPKLDPASLYQKTRPKGPLSPSEASPTSLATSEADSAVTEPADLARASRAAQKGNHVRAAILYGQVPAFSTQAREQIDKLVERLGDICEWDAATRSVWSEALARLIGPASRGDWSRTARCLYELQKIPTDLRGTVYAVDVIEWARSLGRLPIKRPLLRTPNVILLGHLRAAEKQLLRSGVATDDRSCLEKLLHDQTHRSSHRIRDEFTPLIVKVVENAGLRPSSTVESVARDKLVAELLDRVCERGYLRFGDLRDSIARNQLKMPDLAGPWEFLAGDPLLRADTALARELDGVYRRGEIYLRMIHRFSSIFFGTPWGRVLTLYLAIPFGGAFLTLMFAEEMRLIGGGIARFVSNAITAPAKETVWIYDDEAGTSFEWEIDGAGQLTRDVVSSSASHGGEAHGSFLIEWPTVIGLGLFLLLVLHVPPFRRAVLVVLRAIGRTLRRVFYDGPLALWRAPFMRLLRDNRLVRFLVRYFSGPLLLTAVFVALLALVGSSLSGMVRWGSCFLVIAAVVVNSRLGWVIQDRVSEQISDWWRVVRVNLIPGLIATIIAAFKALANWVERKLYDVDEMLRFRTGDSQFSLVCKALFGLVWFPVAYVFRFAFYLLVEPQVNPVKHFPVVTVSHKVIWPMVPTFVEMTGFSAWTVGMVVNGIPGIFGFMAWELKENWRLYRVNRPATLRPVMIGSHGETMRGLLRPGFHSGTVPKTSRKLRRAWRTLRADQISRCHHDLDHVAESVHRFAERELAAVLRSRPEWQNHSVEVAAVHCCCQRVRIVLAVDRKSEITLVFENRDGQIEAAVENPAALNKLNLERRFSFRDAITGLCNLGAAQEYNGKPIAWSWTDWCQRWQRPSQQTDSKLPC